MVAAKRQEVGGGLGRKEMKGGFVMGDLIASDSQSFARSQPHGILSLDVTELRRLAKMRSSIKQGAVREQESR